MLSDLWGSRSRSGGSVVLVDHTVKCFPALDWCVKRHGYWCVMVRRSLLAGLVRAVPVVVVGVLAKDRSKVPFVIDQHPVSALGSCGAYPPLGVTIRPWRPRRGLDHLHALASEISSKARVNLVSRSRIRKRREPARSPRSMSRLRAFWAVQEPSGWAVTPGRGPGDDHQP